MGYCTVADVSALMHEPLWGGDTSPTDDEVAQFISDAGAEIDGVLKARGYPTPVSDSSALDLVKKFTKFGAAVETWHASYRTDDEPPNVEYWRTSYATFLSELRNGKLELPGAVDDKHTDVSIFLQVGRATDD